VISTGGPTRSWNGPPPRRGRHSANSLRTLKTDATCVGSLDSPATPQLPAGSEVKSRSGAQDPDAVNVSGNSGLAPFVPDAESVNVVASASAHWPVTGL
jgi:hypothetical protein